MTDLFDVPERDMDAMAEDLCRRLASAGPRGVGGKRLAVEMDLNNTRALRRLVAHARVNLHRHEILGMPGAGYFWGPAAPAKVAHVINLAGRMARCWFFIAALHKREGTAMAAVQMVFDFMEARPPGDGRQADDLAALVAAEGTSVAEFLDRFVRELAGTADGKRVLAEIGSRHAGLLISDETRRAMVAKLDEVRSELLRAG